MSPWYCFILPVGDVKRQASNEKPCGCWTWRAMYPFPLPSRTPSERRERKTAALAGSSRPSASLFSCACISALLTNSEQKERLLACSLQANWNSGGSKSKAWSVACQLVHFPCPLFAFSSPHPISCRKFSIKPLWGAFLFQAELRGREGALIETGGLFERGEHNRGLRYPGAYTPPAISHTVEWVHTLQQYLD